MLERWLCLVGESVLGQQVSFCGNASGASWSRRVVGRHVGRDLHDESSNRSSKRIEVSAQSDRNTVLHKIAHIRVKKVVVVELRIHGRKTRFLLSNTCAGIPIMAMLADSPNHRKQDPPLASGGSISHPVRDT